MRAILGAGDRKYLYKELNLIDILYFVAAIVFVSGVESILCSSMADKLAENKKTPFNPDKEFFGQGMVQIITPLIH